MTAPLDWPAAGRRGFAAIGECMIELSESDGALTRRYGGDTLNTTVYFNRLTRTMEPRPRYVTALGDDPFSAAMLAEWQSEGIATALVRRLPGALPGLYWIRNDATGERSFSYWRAQAAARRLFDDDHAARLASALAGAGLLYLSGISVAILPEDGRCALLELAAALRDGGALLVTDSNYRSALWDCRDEAVAWLGRLAAITDVALLSFDDERALHDDAAPATVLSRWQQAGAREVIVKDAGQPLHLATGNNTTTLPLLPVTAPVDTTGAGDAFNAGYLAARCAGHDVNAAARTGHRLASCVIMQPGAIIAEHAMPSLATLSTSAS